MCILYNKLCWSIKSFYFILQSTTFHVVYKNVPGALTLDWTDGFLLKPFASATYAFTYSFSQLKGSSDDGNATLTLKFTDPPGGNNLVEQVSFQQFSGIFFYSKRKEVLGEINRMFSKSGRKMGLRAPYVVIYPKDTAIRNAKSSEENCP